MSVGGTLQLVWRDLRRTRGALATAGFGIAAGTASLVFFLGLGLGVRSVLLGEVFPLDKLEFEPKAPADPGLLGLLVGSGPAAGISPDTVQALRSLPAVKQVYPKLRLAFPAGARGGADIFGRDFGAAELMGDAVEATLVQADVQAPWSFADPLAQPGAPCRPDGSCDQGRYCVRVEAEQTSRCVEPVPVLISQYLVELFNKGIAPAHGLPPVGESLISRAQGLTFDLRLGESLLGRARQGAARTVKARIVGVSKRAVDLGITVPLDTARRWNREFAGDRAATDYSAVLVELGNAADASEVIAHADKLGLVPKDTRARDVSVLIHGLMALLTLVATVMLAMAAANIAYSFRALLEERRAEIGLYRAVGASRAAVLRWLLTLAAVVGLAYATLGLAVGLLAAWVTDRLAATRLPDFPFKPSSFFAFPPWMLGGVIAFGVLFALCGAWGPSRRAASADPKKSLVR